MADGGSSAPKPHAVCLPFPAQGHINPMLKLAILLHSRGFFITFVNTEYNHRRLLKSQGPGFLKALPDFKFETIPDGLPTTTGDEDVTQDLVSLFRATQETCLAPFRQLLMKLNKDSPPVSCVIADAIMCFGVVAAQEIGVPSVSFRTTCGASFLANRSLPLLIHKGLLPLKDSTYLTNGYLETPLQIIPELRNFRLKDLPNFVITTDKNDFMLNTVINLADEALKASAMAFNTFDELEHPVLTSLAKICPPIYPIGPLHFHTNRHLPEATLNLIRGNLWKEDSECLEWLSCKPPKSVLYVNFGSIAVLSKEQVMELAWGLAKSGKNFLWVVREDSISCSGRKEILPPEFKEETAGKGLIAKWCPQEQVLQHPSIGGFLTHCGWNSMIESLCCGVPMICLPFFADQHLNCRAACSEWGVGLEMENGVDRNEVEKLVKELIDGVKGKELQKAAEEWKCKAEAATKRDGSSYLNFDKLVKDVLLSNQQ